MQQSRSKLKKLFLWSILGLLSGCASLAMHKPQQDFSHYLDSFIGSTREDVVSKINFLQYGFEVVTLNQSSQSQNLLVYSVLRSINIPLPEQSSASAETGMSAIPANLGHSYQIKQTCIISLKLEQNRVTRWHSEGRAC